jgi:hypothetical protein
LYGLSGLTSRSDDVDTALALHLLVAGVAGAVAELDVADLGWAKAFPLAGERQRFAALACELVSQRDLLPIGVAEDDRAELAWVAVVPAKDLLVTAHGCFEQCVSRAGHREARHQWAWRPRSQYRAAERTEPAGDLRIERFGWRFGPGDKVMQIKNDYDKEVYNGDLGVISRVDSEDAELAGMWSKTALTRG